MKYLFIISFLFPTVLFSQDFSFNYSKDFNPILEKTKTKGDSLFYPIQLERFIKNDSTLTDFEVLALLIGHTADSNYHPYSDIDVERKIYSLNSSRNFKEAMNIGRNFLSKHPLNQMTNIEMSYSYYKLNKPDSSKLYTYRYTRIMNAMARSGKGTTSDSSLFSLTPIDGQNFCRKYLGFKIGTMGSGSDSNGNFLDILSVYSKDSENKKEKPLYFNIQHAMKEMQSQIKNAIKK